MTRLSSKTLQQLIQPPQASSSKLALGETTEIELMRDLIPESDIADQYYDNILSPDNQNSTAVDATEIPPPRPGSRLDFNAHEEINEVEADAPVLGPKPPRFEWTKSLFQRIGIHRASSSGKAVHELPEIRPSHQDPSYPSSSPFPSASHSVDPQAHGSLIYNIRFTLCASDEDEEATDGETSDEESEIDLDCLSLSDFDLEDPDVRPSSVTEATVGESHPVPSIYPLPSSDLDESIMNSPLPDSEHHPKAILSSLPSCLSPRFLSKARSRGASLPPRRHNYENRGHSRHALMHLKWFWASREEEWAEFENATRVYGGISSSPELPASSFASRFPRLFASARTRPPNANQDAEAPRSPLVSMPPMTIHPRWGDLSGLKDSWCVHMDRYFVEVPIWRIRKSLWTADLQVMSMMHKRRREEREESGCEEDDADTESLMHMSMLTGLSDDSDLTLVESDCEEEAVTTQLVSVSESAEAVAGGKEKADLFYHDDDGEPDEYLGDVDLDSPSSSSTMGASSSMCRYMPPSSKTSPTSCFQNPDVLSQPIFSFQPPYSPYCSTPNLLQGLGHPWATSWFHRSQLLLQLLATSAEHEMHPSGLGTEIEYEKTHQQRSFTYEDIYPGALEKSTSSRSRTVSV